MYTTELTEKILTSDSARRMVQRVTNLYGDSYVGLWLYQVMGMSNDEVKAMVDDFKLQVVPQTATWSLSYWENSLGITVNESLSDEERRQNIIEKRRKRTPMNPARIEQIISAMTGADVRMDEYYGKNRFAIYIAYVPTEEDAALIRAKLKSIKQTQKVFSIFYESSEETAKAMYVGAVTVRDRQKQAVAAAGIKSTETLAERKMYVGAVNVCDKQTQIIGAAAMATRETVTGRTYAGTAAVYDRQTTAVGAVE